MRKEDMRKRTQFTLALVGLLLLGGIFAYAGSLKKIIAVTMTTGTGSTTTIDPFSNGWVAFVQLEYAAAVGSTNTITLTRAGVATTLYSESSDSASAFMFLPESHIWVSIGDTIHITNSTAQTLNGFIGIEHE